MPLWTPTAEPQMQFAVTHRPAADLPQTALGPLFAVAGGLCHVAIVGRVTTALGATANSAKFVADPTSGADTDLCTAADIASVALGNWIFPAAPTTALQISPNPGASVGAVTIAQSLGEIHAIGNVSLNTTANQTGQVEYWAMWYPIESGAYVVSV